MTKTDIVEDATIAIIDAVDAIGDAIALPHLGAIAKEEEKTLVKEDEDVIVAEKEEVKKTKKPVIFPVNPNSFTPMGLIQVRKPVTKNGRVIYWLDPITRTAVFRWDENINFKNGPHYHIIGDSKHYTPGVDVVPEQ